MELLALGIIAMIVLVMAPMTTQATQEQAEATGMPLGCLSLAAILFVVAVVGVAVVGWAAMYQ
jgi:hypothetical protein